MTGLPQLLRQEARRWAALGIAALAAAGILALLLALSRTPVIQDYMPWPWESFFYKALVTHVVLSVVVWFLAILGVITTLAWGLAIRDYRSIVAVGEADLMALPARAGPILSAAGCVMIVAPALLDLGEPIINNYVPVLVHPLYFIGLLCVAAGVLFPVLRLLIGTARPVWRAEVSTPSIIGAGGTGIAYLFALLCFAIALALTPAMSDPKEYYEWVFWGGGHILQVVNTMSMITIWAILAPRAFGRPLMADRPFLLLIIALILAAGAGPVAYGLFDYPSSDNYTFFTALYSYALAPPLACACIALLLLLHERIGGLDLTRPAHMGLILAVVLCGFGGLYGFFSGYADTRTPAHYHAAIGGVNVAAMALFLSILPTLNGTLESRVKRRAWPLWFYGIGTAMHSSGLFLAGTAGVARKTAGAEQGLDSIWEVGSMSLMGIGGVVAVIGGVLFIWIASRELWRSRHPENALFGAATTSFSRDHSP